MADYCESVICHLLWVQNGVQVCLHIFLIELGRGEDGFRVSGPRDQMQLLIALGACCHVLRVFREDESVVRTMEEGHGISQAAIDADLFEPLYGRMLLAGERSGNLENVLGRLTEHLEQNCGDLVDRLVSVVDPLLSGVLMVTVGLSLLSVMLPLIGMMSSVG